jgi:hypothetical protein
LLYVRMLICLLITPSLNKERKKNNMVIIMHALMQLGREPETNPPTVHAPL